MSCAGITAPLPTSMPMKTAHLPMTSSPGQQSDRGPMPYETVDTRIAAAAISSHRRWYAVGLLATVLIAWAVVGIAVERIRLAAVAPGLQAALEGASALARLFGAFVLLLAPSDRFADRLRWVAGGLVILSIGGFAFGYLPSGRGDDLNANTLMYTSLYVWTVAGVFFVLGLVPRQVASLRWIGPLFGTAVAIGLLVLVLVSRSTLPLLVRQTDFEAAVIQGNVPLPGLTLWHWALSLVPLALALAVVIGAALHLGIERIGGWLVVAMTLLAGSQVHNLLWPSAFGPVLTSANLLRFCFALSIVIGSAYELRRIATERTALLASERDYSRRLTDLTRLRSDFTAMAAHELGSPVAAISGWAEMLATGDLSPEQRSRAVATIRVEAKALNSLVTDVRTVINAERADFSVQPVPVSLEEIITDAVAFARVLPDEHWISWSYDLSGIVLADPLRIGQVLRNLISNAAKYSPPNSPIEVRVTRRDRRVQIDVIDAGYGIHPDDMKRVFEKFGRGRDSEGRRIQGVGLGLYLSHQIVRAHGSKLTVDSTLGEGSIFGFTLELVP